jgi:hypothetical protein
VKDEFDAFLECGILTHGFLWLRCGERGHDKLLAFSCKRRGVLSLPNFLWAADSDPLDAATMAAIAAGVSTRRYASTQEPLPAAHHPNATSKSAVSRRFVQLSASSWPSGWRGRWASRTWPWS